MSDISPEQIDAEIEKALERRKLDFYKPYPKQLAFHAASAEKGAKEILLMAGNQIGKTMSAAAQTAYFATGLYPDWWPGRKFPGPTAGWVGSPTGQTSRDNPQRLLLGNVGEWGTGMIPGRSIIEIKRSTHGLTDQVETILIEHKATKRISRLLFKTYDQGRIRWQGETINYVWFDEEPPDDVYSEGLTRTNVLNGFVFMTFTPLLGMSAVVARFIREKPPGSAVIKMGISDALHYSEENRKAIIARYPEHERKARAEGDPVMGSGAVFPVPVEWITEVPIQIPEFWPRLAGLDLGWDHPTACAWMAYDRDADCIHVYDTYRAREQTPVIHAAAIKAKGPWIPVAWPHDAMTHDSGSGKVIAQQYREFGVAMLPLHATHPPQAGKREGTGGNGLEAGIMEMLTRMQTGRFKVANHLSDWLDEYRNYYRKDGLIEKEGDDLMSATRMGVMMIRFAKLRVNRDIVPKLGEFQSFDVGMGTLG
jgi:phage terminase large subunit-like protein